jgi:hypothetical protein
MIDFKYILRSAYYALLNGNLTSGGNPVPVADTLDPIIDMGTIYVLLVNEVGISDNTHQSFMSEEKIRVDIIARGVRVSTKTVDDLAGQILGIILPTPQNSALGNSKIINCRLTDDRYQNFHAAGANNVARRILTFTQTVAQ